MPPTEKYSFREWGVVKRMQINAISGASINFTSSIPQASDVKLLLDEEAVVESNTPY